MGADNWAACPQCEKNHEDELVNRRLGLENLYASVDRATYEEAREELADLEREGTSGPSSLREDYWFDNDDCGQVEVYYHGGCTECGLDVVFKHTIDLMA